MICHNCVSHGKISFSLETVGAKVQCTRCYLGLTWSLNSVLQGLGSIPDLDQPCHLQQHTLLSPWCPQIRIAEKEAAKKDNEHSHPA